MVWEAESYDKITAILSDPEYLERVVPDAELSERLTGADRSVVQRRVVACRIAEES